MEDTHIKEMKDETRSGEDQEGREMTAAGDIDTDSSASGNEAVIRIPLNGDNVREELNFYKLLKAHFREYGKNSDDIDFIIKNLEDQIAVFNSGSPLLPDEEKFIAAIEKHPYFKNPCDYPIRMITILKYLKRRGFNMNYTDIDLYVDKILQKMDGVRKVGRGLYKKQQV